MNTPVVPPVNERLPVRLTVTLKEASAALGIPMGTAYQLLARGEFPLPTRKVGRRYLIAVAAVHEFLGSEMQWPEGARIANRSASQCVKEESAEDFE